MATLLKYSTPAIISDKRVCRDLNMAAILKMSKYQTQFQVDIRYEKIVPN